MRIRPLDVFGNSVPDATAKRIGEVGQGALRIKVKAPGHLPRYRIVFDNQFASDDVLTVTLLIAPKTMVVDLSRKRACHANILAKMQTIEVEGAPLTAMLTDREPLKLKRDRSFLWVRPEIAPALEGSSAFRDAPGLLHEPPDGFERRGSWKTSADKRAGLQVVLHQKGDEWLGEFDIDLRTGVAHWFEALGNAIGKRKTDPYIVAQMLVQQGIDPGYEFRAGD